MLTGFRHHPRASGAGQIHTDSPQELKSAQTQGISVEQLKKEEDFDPTSFQGRPVEENGNSRLATSILPPSMDGLTL